MSPPLSALTSTPILACAVAVLRPQQKAPGLCSKSVLRPQQVILQAAARLYYICADIPWATSLHEAAAALLCRAAGHCLIWRTTLPASAVPALHLSGTGPCTVALVDRCGLRCSLLVWSSLADAERGCGSCCGTGCGAGFCAGCCARCDRLKLQADAFCTNAKALHRWRALVAV